MTNPTQSSNTNNSDKIASDVDVSDLSISEGWENLERLLKQQQKELPDESIDKQIIAAAHREIELPGKPREYRLGWWRKLSLPLYITAAFTFTAIGFNALWQEPGYIIESDKPHTTSIEFNSGSVTVEEKTEQSSPVKRELPELVVAPTSFGATPKESSKEEFSTQEQQKSLPTIDVKEVYTGTELSRAAYPEKEAWVHQIIELMKKGESEAARKELTRFKKAYPDYPIEEQIKVLIR